MNLTNLTSNTYDLPNDQQLGALATIAIADADYNAQTDLAAVVNSLVSSGNASVASAPAGFPRNTHSYRQLPDPALGNVGDSLKLDANKQPHWAP